MIPVTVIEVSPQEANISERKTKNFHTNTIRGKPEFRRDALFSITNYYVENVAADRTSEASPRSPCVRLSQVFPIGRTRNKRNRPNVHGICTFSLHQGADLLWCGAFKAQRQWDQRRRCNGVRLSYLQNLFFLQPLQTELIRGFAGTKIKSFFIQPSVFDHQFIIRKSMPM